MDLDTVMKQMEAGQEKVAAAAVRAATASVPQEANALASALEKAAQAVTSESPRANDAVAALQATAEKLASQEREADVAHAQLCGQAFADGAINKFAAYDAATKIAMAQQPATAPVVGMPKVSNVQVGDPQLQQKLAAQQYLANLTASDLQGISQADYLKLAQLKEASELSRGELMKVAANQGDDESLYKLAAEQGYLDTMEKAATDYQAGAQDALEEVHSVASGEFLKGAAEAEMLINHYRSQG